MNNSVTNITVKTLDRTWKQQVDVPSDMSFGNFKKAAQEQVGILDVPYTLIHDQSGKLMRDNDTFAIAKIPHNASFTLAPENEGGEK